jgi:hypothetical protein
MGLLGAKVTQSPTGSYIGLFFAIAYILRAISRPDRPDPRFIIKNFSFKPNQFRRRNSADQAPPSEASNAPQSDTVIEAEFKRSSPDSDNAPLN